MNYWLITTEYPPAYGGGIGTYCFQTARMLTLHGYTVTVFVHGKNATSDKLYYENGVRIVEFAPNRTDVWNYLGYETALSFEYAAVIQEYMKNEGVPSVLESQEYGGVAYYILQYKHLGYNYFKELKVLLTLHAPSFLYNDYNRLPAYRLPYFWIGEMERWCIRAADMVNAPGNFIIEAIKPYFKNSALPANIEVIPYPFESCSTDIKIQDGNELKWFFFGKLTPQKGIKKLLRAYHNLINDGWQTPLHLIGGGDHLDHIENTSVKTWIKRKYQKEITAGKLIMLGNLNPQKWHTLICKDTVIIIPSIGDNYPFTVMESMNNGQLVLASKQGGQQELIVHEHNGLLFDHDVPGDLEKQMKKLKSLTASQLNQIRQNAVHSVDQKHNYGVVFEQKQKLLDKLIHQKTDPGIFPFVRNDFKLQNNLHATDISGSLLSVVIPFYNLGNYIGDTLESLSQSKYFPIEIIVINDGSDDSNVEKLKLLQATYKFIIHNQTNQGLAAARNTGANLARGKYLAFVDADDKIDADYFSKAIEILENKQNVSFIGSWVQYFEGSNGVWPSFNPEPPYLLYYNTVCSGGLVYKKEAFINGGLNDSSFEYGLEDWEHVINMVKNGYYGVVIPEKLYHYRIRKNSMARNFNLNKLLYSIRKIAVKHEIFYQQYAVDLNGLVNENGSGFKNDNPTLDKYNYGLLGNKYPLLKKAMDYAKRNSMVKGFAFKIYELIKK